MRVLAISVLKLDKTGPLRNGSSLFVLSLMEALREISDVQFCLLRHLDMPELNNSGDVRTFFPNPLNSFLLRQIHSLIFGVKPSFWIYRSTELKTHLKSIRARDVDLVIFLDEMSALYERYISANLPKVLIRHNLNSKTISIDCRSLLGFARTMASKYHSWRFDHWTGKKFSAITLGAAEEVSILRRVTSRAVVSYLPTVSRFDVFTRDRVAEVKKKSAAATRILFIANFIYPPNVEAVLWLSCCERYLSERSLQNLTFVLVGRDPPSLPASSKMKFEALGFVKDVLPIVGSCQLAVIPIVSGSGLKLKALTLLSSGLPVVTTSEGVLGIEAKHGLHCLIADDHKAFAESIEQLCLDPQLGDFLQDNAFSLVREKYSSKAQNEALAALLSSMLADRSNGSEISHAN